jgi:Fe-S cluster assembly protein SufD
MLQLTKEKEMYLADWEPFAEATENGEPGWVRQIRANASKRFQELRFPSVKDEDWKYTNPAPILGVPFRTDPTAVIPPPPVAGPQVFGIDTGGNTLEMLFVNGSLILEVRHDTELPSGVLIGTLAKMRPEARERMENFLAHSASIDQDAFVALNASFLHQAVYVFVPDNVAVEVPIHLMFVSTSSEGLTASHPRVMIGLGRNASATVIETYSAFGDERYFTNAVTDVVLGDGAQLEHYKLLEESDKAFHVGHINVQQERDSRFTSFNVALGGALARTDLNVALDAPGAECHLQGLYVVDGTQHVDYHTFIRHAAPHCSSREVYKGVLDGRSRAVFSGKVLVEKGADGTDAQQQNRNLMLSDNAHVDTKPQLEIFADDVKCSHGAAIGQLDEDQLFYLETRGIADEAARRLLIYGFASDVVNKIRAPSIRHQLEHQLAQRLRGDDADEVLED